MKNNMFISFAGADVDIVENLSDHLRRYGITTWVYSLDRTLAADAWKEIQAKIAESDLLIFIVSEDTPNAAGQRRELKLAVEKVEPLAGRGRIMPVVINGTQFSALPEELGCMNGFVLDGFTVKSVAWEIANQAFPSLVEKECGTPWKHPVPGQWLQVSSLDGGIERCFDLGDKLYFREISPMGLFECYAPKIQGLFWIASENVRASNDLEADRLLENSIPSIHTVSGTIEILQLGWKAWHDQQDAELQKDG